MHWTVIAPTPLAAYRHQHFCTELALTNMPGEFLVVVVKFSRTFTDRVASLRSG
jgi:hypothetical protein